MPSNPDRPRAIAARLAELLGGSIATVPRRLGGGASQETWTFVLERPGAHRQPLVLQSRRGDAGAAHELQERPSSGPLLRAAQAAGVPVAAVLADGEDDPVLGAAWVVVEHLGGGADPATILGGVDVPPADVLLDQVAAALAAVHRIDARVPEPANPLTELRALHDRLGQPHPTFELAFRALEPGPPAATRRTLVHGDFRLGNLLVDATGLVAVLDWELAHRGDPLLDLGWLCVRAWRFDRPDRAAAGLGTREQLIDAYERHAGLRIDRAALDWWELFGTLRWGVICVVQAFTHLGAKKGSLEHAVIGRRACEVEWDLLELLDPGGATAPAAPGGAPLAPVLHDRPTALELLDATRAEIAADVLPELDGRPAFKLRVAMRALGIVRRELEHAQAHGAVRERALAGLGAADEADLAGRIRSGALDDRAADVHAALRACTRAKLEAANPRHLQPIGEPRT